MHAATTSAKARRSPSGRPDEPRGDREARDARDPGHDHCDGDRRTEATRDGREREAANGIDVLDGTKQRGIVDEALEADQRPRAEDEAGGGPGCPERRPEPPGQEEPDDERPDEQLGRHRDPDGEPDDASAIAVAPRDREGKDEENREVSVEEAVNHRRRGERDDVAAPVADAEDPERCEHADAEQAEPEPRRESDGQQSERDRGEDEEGWVDRGVPDDHGVARRLRIDGAAVEEGAGRLPERPAEVEPDRPRVEVSEKDAQERERDRDHGEQERITELAKRTGEPRPYLLLTHGRHVLTSSHPIR